MAEQKYPTQAPLPEGPPPAYDEGYCNPPPQQTPPPQPQSQGASATNVTVEKKPAPAPEKKGFFSKLKDEATKVGKQIGKELDKAGDKINEVVDKNYTSALLDLFKNGNVVQLVSRVTGRAVQIVMSASGQMVLDANGPLDPNAFNSMWTVVNEGYNQIRLHNYNNYISIVEGQTVLTNYPPGATLGPETKFQLSQINQQFVMLESLKEKTRHVGFLQNGELKPALATAKEQNAQFGVKLVSTSYPVVTKVSTTH